MGGHDRVVAQDADLAAVVPHDGGDAAYRRYCWHSRLPFDHTTSPISGKAVTQDQLAAETSIAGRDLQTQRAILTAKAADLKDKLGPAYAELERKQEAVNTVVGTISGLIDQYVPGPWQGVAATGFSALLLGLGLDNRRKDRLIENIERSP